MFNKSNIFRFFLFTTRFSAHTYIVFFFGTYRCQLYLLLYEYIRCKLVPLLNVDEYPKIFWSLVESAHPSASISTSGVPHYKHLSADEPNLSPVSQNAIIQVSEMYMRCAFASYSWQLDSPRFISDSSALANWGTNSLYLIRICTTK